MTRITNNMMINSFRKNYMDINEKLNKYMNQLSSGEKFSKISEAPLKGTKSLKLETILSYNGKYADNAESGISWLEVTDGALDDTVKTLRALRDKAVYGATESMTTSDRQKLASEVGQLRQYLVQLGNTKYGDRYIFNGTETKTKPYTDGGTNNAGDYLNDGAVQSNSIYREVSEGVKVEINVTGNNIGASGFSQMFADIDQLQQDLNAGDTTGIQDAIDNIDDHIEGALQARSRVGARQNRLEMTQNRLEAQEVSYTDILSETQDADIAETIMNLKNQENVYRAALATGARVIQPSLVDFLQ